MYEEQIRDLQSMVQEFMMVTKYIGKNIASAYAKLEKLTMLAKKMSLFDDRPQEIHELTYIMVYALQSKLASMGTDFKPLYTVVLLYIRNFKRLKLYIRNSQANIKVLL
ncbi:PREDICTED: syntaxin-5-like [Rhagoletis zephyria]|uniref:syntaxin-5-like n=1 Tax=Rhagoletis zephyria TaxID=28612 RepID=UPI0008117F7D|nr:PREDICTED: syntaxin-5-like [Rhagoletis zephyria]XP_017468230.1 PREDICTED: syntaxin-5-like [Rhagoletis zephyria]XP_017468231.1 PREDICTED: syntaxin-5-like [Rhagoletis zephyria]